MIEYFRLNDSKSTTPIAFRSDEFTTTTRLREIRAHMDAAATTSEDFTVTIEAASSLGATYSTVVYRLDLSAASTEDISNTGRAELILPGDRIRVDYPNTDGINVAWQVFLSREV